MTGRVQHTDPCVLVSAIGPTLLPCCYVTLVLVVDSIVVSKMRLSTSYLQRCAGDNHSSRYRKRFKAVRLITVIDSPAISMLFLRIAPITSFPTT